MVITSLAQLQNFHEIPLETDFVENGERWKNTPIPGFEQKYLISTEGRIYGISRHKIKKSCRCGDARYNYVGTLFRNGKSQKPVFMQTGLVVALTFVPIPDGMDRERDELQVNHLDQNPLNNCASNLEWCSPGENCRYGDRSLRSAKARTKLRAPLSAEQLAEYEQRDYGPNAKPVAQYMLSGEFIRTYKSVTQAAAIAQISASGIIACCKHSRGCTQSGGFYWEYI